MQEAYDHYVSLGQDCEVSFQHRRVLGADSSGFFSWNITTLPALESILSNNFSGVLQEERLEKHGDGSMLLDRSHDFMIPSPFVWDDFRADPEYTEKLTRLREKFLYFQEKFHAQAQSGERVAYFYKAEQDLSMAGVHAAAVRIHALLRGVHGGGGGRFSLIVLQGKEKEAAQWPEPGIFNRYLRRLAPWDDAPDGHVPSWDRVFREFPHGKGLRLAGY